MLRSHAGLHVAMGVLVLVHKGHSLHQLLADPPGFGLGHSIVLAISEARLQVPSRKIFHGDEDGIAEPVPAIGPNEAGAILFHVTSVEGGSQTWEGTVGVPACEKT